MSSYRFQSGKIPLLVSMPHVGTLVPEAILSRMTDRAQPLPDTDRHLEQLYSFLAELGAGVIVAEYSRYVVDLNRPPDNSPLYAGVATTELCPTLLFDGSPIYLAGECPNSTEVTQRLQNYWQPYHDRLKAELVRLREIYGIAVLWEAHSIRSQLPRLFAGLLPDLSLGTFGGNSADRQLTERLFAIAQQHLPYTAVLNGRFQGGYITRHYGHPAADIHAIQLELVQATYMQEEPPFQFLEEKAIAIRPVLRHLLETVVDWILQSPNFHDSSLCEDSTDLHPG